MNRLIKWFKRLWCWLSGGHVYEDINLISHYDERNMMFTFRNRCCRCGKVCEWEVPAEHLLPKKPSMYVFVEDEYG